MVIGGGEGNRIAGASQSYFEKERLMNIFREPLRIDYADKKWSIRKVYITKLGKQEKTAQYLSFLSPSEIFKKSINSLCATGAESHYRFLDQARKYREDLIRYYKENKFFSSYLYFTQQDPKSFMTADEMVNTLTNGEIKTLADLRWNLAFAGYNADVLLKNQEKHYEDLTAPTLSGRER